MFSAPEALPRCDETGIDAKSQQPGLPQSSAAAKHADKRGENTKLHDARPSSGQS